MNQDTKDKMLFTKHDVNVGYEPGNKGYYVIYKAWC